MAEVRNPLRVLLPGKSSRRQAAQEGRGSPAVHGARPVTGSVSAIAPNPGCNSNSTVANLGDPDRRHQPEASVLMARYLARPPIAADRLAQLEDRRLELQLKRPWRDGTTAFRYSPHELVERLIGLVPRPRAHLARTMVCWPLLLQPDPRIVPSKLDETTARYTPPTPPGAEAPKKPGWPRPRTSLPRFTPTCPAGPSPWATSPAYAGWSATSSAPSRRRRRPSTWQTGPRRPSCRPSATWCGGGSATCAAIPCQSSRWRGPRPCGPPPWTSVCSPRPAPSRSGRTPAAARSRWPPSSRCSIACSSGCPRSRPARRSDPGRATRAHRPRCGGPGLPRGARPRPGDGSRQPGAAGRREPRRAHRPKPNRLTDPLLPIAPDDVGGVLLDGGAGGVLHCGGLHPAGSPHRSRARSPSRSAR